MAKRRTQGGHTLDLVGRMETELRAAQYAHAGMIANAERGKPGPETTNETMIGRSLVARHAIAAVDLAMEVAGGSAFFRDNGLERRFRDVQGARYHPMREGPQREFSGRIALGMDTATTF
jgi:alkylation response protein AidB-like acyl-CoA dehydrogenase